jgi:hypothetical protein
LVSLPGLNTIKGCNLKIGLEQPKKIWKKLGIKPQDIIADNLYFQKKSTRRR